MLRTPKQRMELSDLVWYEGGCEKLGNATDAGYYAPQSYYSPTPGAPPLPEECAYVGPMHSSGGSNVTSNSNA